MRKLMAGAALALLVFTAGVAVGREQVYGESFTVQLGNDIAEVAVRFKIRSNLQLYTDSISILLIGSVKDYIEQNIGPVTSLDFHCSKRLVEVCDSVEGS